MYREIQRKATNGLLMLFILLALLAVALERVISAIRDQSPVLAISMVVVIGVLLTALGGLFTVNPNDGKVLSLFGKYVGTVRDQGLWWANPFYSKTRVSLRVRNFETTKLKVNDSHSNPIEIGAIIVWKVVDTAEALFEVDDYAAYVQMQSESAVRSLAQTFPYDSHKEGEVALSTNPAEIAHGLQLATSDRLQKAGVEVIEARISHLAYAPEIASAMLRRQQAAAVIAARTKIVEGAVGMVENALAMIAERSLVQLDEERKAAMVSNLLVVLCSDREVTPVINTGTIYQ
jgi:regulator of protease activity HflC (stomatin/prohibitin superfamily)